MQSNSNIKDISIKSNKTFLLEYFTHFFYIFSNKGIEAFKKKNLSNFNANNINSINIEYLYKNKVSSNGSNINNNFNLNNNNDIYPNLFGKVKSDYSLNLIDDNKKILNDNKLFDFNDNYNFSGDISYHPKLSIFGNTSLNNIPSPEPLFNLKNFTSKSFSNSLNKIPSLGNLNNINNISNLNLNPHNKIGFFDVYMNNSINNFNTMNNMSLNNLKNSSPNLFNNSNTNLLQLNPENIVKSTLLSPPPKYPFSLGQPTIMPNVNEKNTNYSFVNSIGDNNNIKSDSEKNSTTLNMFNKKRKRDIKNNKLVFIAENNKKEKIEKKEKEEKEKSSNVSYANNTENTETPNHTQTNNIDSNDINSDKSKKPRGSKFRGVSRNGNQWQVLIMVNKKKRYVGSYSKEEEAAKAYDKVALQNHGSKAKTNFDYTKKEVEEILAAPQLLKLY